MHCIRFFRNHTHHYTHKLLDKSLFFLPLYATTVDSKWNNKCVIELQNLFSRGFIKIKKLDLLFCLFFSAQNKLQLVISLSLQQYFVSGVTVMFPSSPGEVTSSLRLKRQQAMATRSITTETCESKMCVIYIIKKRQKPLEIFELLGQKFEIKFFFQLWTVKNK